MKRIVLGVEKMRRKDINGILGGMLMKAMLDPEIRIDFGWKSITVYQERIGELNEKTVKLILSSDQNQLIQGYTKPRSGEFNLEKIKLYCECANIISDYNIPSHYNLKLNEIKQLIELLIQYKEKLDERLKADIVSNIPKFKLPSLLSDPLFYKVLAENNDRVELRDKSYIFLLNNLDPDLVKEEHEKSLNIGALERLSVLIMEKKVKIELLEGGTNV